MKKALLPVGVDDFQMIREQGFVYVDKTAFIGKLIASRGMVNLFTRPRRFGKTLTMSMLQAFFEIGGNRALFSGLAIEADREVCSQYQGQFPVLRLTLKALEGSDMNSALSKLRVLVATECKRHGYLGDSPRVNAYDKALFGELCAQSSDETQLAFSLATLMRMLHAHWNQRVILLIDEYDVPLAKSFEGGYYADMAAFLRIFFGEAFKSNPDVQFAVLTGCLRISKESIFTGVNNLKVDGISDDRFDEYFGFTDADVQGLLQALGLHKAYEEMRRWYNGYHFGATDVYCPWDVISHCDKLLAQPQAKAQAYWNNTSSNSIVKLFIDRADNATRDDIERLMVGQAIERPIVENLTYAELDESIDNLWSVLYLTGYLTRDRARPAQNEDCVRLVIPNQEVQTIFVDKIQKWFRQRLQQESDQLRALYGALATGQVRTVERIIACELRYSISYHDQREDFYHGLLIGLLVGNPMWTVRSNRETGLGRSDIVIVDDVNRVGIVIEIKRAERAIDMGGKCEQALEQIRHKRYGDELLVMMDTVWAYAIAFADKSCRMAVQKLK